jgi:hypothetical protein
MCFLEPEKPEMKPTDLSLADIIDTYTPTGSVNSNKQKETDRSHQEKIKAMLEKDALLFKDLKFKNLNTFGDENEHGLSNASSPKFYKSRTSVKTNREIEQFVKNKKVLLSKLSFKEDELCPIIEEKIKVKEYSKQGTKQKQDKETLQLKDGGKQNNQKFNQNLLFTHNEELNNMEEIVILN